MVGDLNFKIFDEHEVGVVQLAEHSKSLGLCETHEWSYMSTLKLMNFLNAELAEYDAILGTN